MGGYSSEAQISLKSGRTVFENLDRTIYAPYAIEVLQEGWNCVLENGSKIPVNKADFTLKMDEKLSFLMRFSTPYTARPARTAFFKRI